MHADAERPSVPVLDVEARGAIHCVRLNRPQRLNAIDQVLAEALLTYFESRRRDRDIRVIVLSGAGRAFCAGADLRAAEDPGGRPLEGGGDGDWLLRDVIKAMRACPQPLIALVHGAAAGGGMALALACDVLVASDSASFHPAFMKVGLSGAELGVSWRLQRMIGVSRARAMLLTGRPMPAADALQSGLVCAVVPHAQLDGYGLSMAQDMLAAAPDALRLTKRSLDASLEIASVDAAMELEERAQVLSIVRTSSPAFAGRRASTDPADAGGMP
jgi:enoyl-CoA hydratase/carnithine racemase